MFWGRAMAAKGVTEVAWNEAFPLVQNLMEEAPALYPPRYRVRRFPDAGMLAELARRGVCRDGAGGGDAGASARRRGKHCRLLTPHLKTGRTHPLHHDRSSKRSPIRRGDESCSS
jgi:hypothetical protein